MRLTLPALLLIALLFTRNEIQSIRALSRERVIGGVELSEKRVSQCDIRLDNVYKRNKRISFGNNQSFDLEILINRNRNVLTKKRVPTNTKKTWKITGGRKGPQVTLIIRRNLAALRYAYVQYCKKNPSTPDGEITVLFTINEWGHIMQCKVSKTTINDKELEQIIIQKIQSWAFGECDIKGDETEVTFPFVFKK